MVRPRFPTLAATVMAVAGCLVFAGFSCTTPQEKPKADAAAEAAGKAGGGGDGATAPKGMSLSDFRAKLPGLDPSGLDASQRAAVVKVARDVLCGCGRPTTLAGCLKDQPDCDLAKRMGMLTKRLVEAGLTALETSDLVEKHYGGFDPSARVKVPIVADQCKGPKDAPVTLVEFADFQCPFCGLAWPLIHDVVDAMPEKVRWCFINFPLNMHEHSHDAAEVAEYARTKGKFFQMADELFQNQTDLSRDKLPGYAAKIGLDPAKVKEVLAKGSLMKDVNAQRAEGDKLGVDGTPTLYINGRKFVLPLNAEMLVWSIQDELVYESHGGKWTGK